MKGTVNMLKLKKVAIILLIAIALISIASSVRADEIQNIIDERENNTTNETENNVVNNTVNNAVNNTNTNTAVNTLPKAGNRESSAVLAILVIFGVSAIYAYKKIRDYRTS